MPMNIEQCLICRQNNNNAYYKVVRTKFQSGAVNLFKCVTTMKISVAIPNFDIVNQFYALRLA